MDNTNKWNSGFWIDEFAKLANGPNQAEAFLNRNSGKTKTTESNRNNWNSQDFQTNLVETTESKGEHNQNHYINTNNALDDKRTIHGNDSAGSRNNSMATKTREESRSSNDYQKAKIEDSEKYNKKKNYNTEQISCTLHDLLLGINSTVIKEAIHKMEEEGRVQQQQQGKNTNSSPNIVSFESIVEEEKKLKKYNTNAKEFIPSFAKWD